MIQKFADWLVYDIFGLDASTAQRDNGHYKCLFPDRTFAQLFDIS